MIRKVLIAAFILILTIPAVAQGAPAVPTVVSGADLKKVVPDTYFFRGLSATTQQPRNASAIHYPDDFYVIVALVDTSGYSSDVKAKYNGMFITEKTLKFGSSTLGPGQYGMGYTSDGKFHILSVDGNELLVTDIVTDEKLARPQPLKIVMDGATAKLYLGKKYVTFTAQ